MQLQSRLLVVGQDADILGLTKYHDKILSA